MFSVLKIASGINNNIINKAFMARKMPLSNLATNPTIGRKEGIKSNRSQMKLYKL